MPNPSIQSPASTDTPPSDVPPPTKPLPDMPDTPEPMPTPGDPPSNAQDDLIDRDSPGATVLGEGDAEPNEPA